MARELQKFTSEFGEFWVEIEDLSVSNNSEDDDGFRDYHKEDKGEKSVVNKATKKFRDTIEGIIPMVKELQSITQGINLKEVEVEVGLQFKKELDLFVVSGGANINFKVKFKWEVGAASPSGPVNT